MQLQNCFFFFFHVNKEGKGRGTKSFGGLLEIRASLLKTTIKLEVLPDQTLRSLVYRGRTDLTVLSLFWSLRVDLCINSDVFSGGFNLDVVIF